jgi:hypothetical protein
MFRRSRETMIALRARHEAFRIATEVGRPHMEAPPPPEPAIPVRSGDWEPGDWKPESRPPMYIEYADAADEEVTPPQPQSPVARVLMSDLVLSLLMILIGAGVIVLCKYG